MSRRQILALVILVLIGAATSHLLKNTRSLGRNVATSAAALEISKDQLSPRTATASADLTVVVFTDYQCSACRRAHPALQRAVARDGGVRVVYKDWPIFGERSVRAARVALAGHYQGIYPSLHDRLMRSPVYKDDDLRSAVESAGGNWALIQADLVARGPAIDLQLAANNRNAVALSLRGTPGYLIWPLLIEGALSEREFLRAFKQARSSS
jgi:protein-disulfide isomerase